MNELTIPPSPNWYEPAMLACSSDNTLIYGAWSDLVIIKNSVDLSIPAKVSIIPKAHSQKVVSVGVNRQWGNPNKFIVSVGEDNIVKVWNADTLKKKVAHNGHLGQSKVIGATFAGEERVISVSEEGIIIVWNINTNDITTFKSIFGFKVEITCISACPHATWLMAFGLKNGLVLIADLRRNGKLIHKLRGHDKSVTSLVWCPVPINIFPKMPDNFVGTKISDLETSQTQEETKHANNIDDTNKVAMNQVLSSDNENRSCISNESVVSENSEDDNKNDTQFSLSDKSLINEISCNENKNEGTKNSESPITVNDLLDNENTNESNFSILVMNDNSVSENKNEIINTDLSIESGTDDISRNANDNEAVNTSNVPVKIIISEISDNESSSKTLDESNLTIKLVINDSSDKNDIKSDLQMTIKEISDQNKSEATDESNLTNKPVFSGISDSDNKSECDSSNESIKNEISDNKKFEASENVDSTNTNKILKEDNLCEVTNESNLTIESVTNDNLIHKDDNKPNTISLENAEVKEISQEQISISENNDYCKDTHESEGDTKQETVAKKVSNSPMSEISSDKIDKKAEKKIISEKEEPRKEFLLASCSREGNIYIWRAGTDGRMQTFFSVGYSNTRKNQSKIDKNWFTLFWATPTKLLSSSRNSELLQWTLPKPKNKYKNVTLIHNDHSSMIFNIIGPVTLLNEYNWTNEPKVNVWTFGHDRLLLNTGLGSRRTNLACYPTLGGSAQCMQLSPLDPNRLALGTGDGHIRIWDLSRPHINKITMTDFYNKIKGKVETIAWHPVNEMLLAFGTMEGRVGCIDTTNKGKMPMVCHQFFNKEIHKVEWGPINGKKNFGIYAVSEGKIVVFGCKSDKEYTELEKPDNTYLFTFAWKQDYSILLVITKAGSVIIYSSDLKILSTHYCQPKMQNILWHPDAAGSCQNISSHCFWFANVHNHKKITIYDLEILKTKEDPQENVIAKYEGLFLITSLSWSPYDPYQMVIGTEAGVAVVWNIKDNQFISTYLNQNFEPILAVSWSPVDSDFIIVGGRDNNINIWRVSSNPPRPETEISDLRRKVFNDMLKETTDLLPNRKEEKVNIDDTPKSKKDKTNDYFPSFYLARNKIQGLNDLKKLMQWKEQSINEEITDETLTESREPNLFDVFGSNSNMINLVKINETKHKERGKYSAQIRLSLFRGDITTAIKEAIQEKRVTTQILSLAPMVSPKLWLEACETYAEQLSQEADSDPFEAVTYYLACHKVQEAIKVLCDAAMYKEALALAKCRLLEGDETILDIIDKWAKQFLYVGNYEMSAECYIFLEKYEDAVSVLFRRQNPEILELAAELAGKCNNSELQKAILTRLNAFKEIKDKEVQCSDLPSRADAVLEINASKMKCIDSNQNNLLTDISVKDCTVINTQVFLNDDTEVKIIANVNNDCTLVQESEIKVCQKQADKLTLASELEYTQCDDNSSQKE